MNTNTNKLRSFVVCQFLLGKVLLVDREKGKEGKIVGIVSIPLR